MSLLELASIEIEYPRRGRPPVRAVAGASLSVARGQVVALVGESGCGKSTLARAAVGLIAPDDGTVSFEGAPLPPLTRRARPRDAARLQMVFQNPYSSLNPRRRVGAQIADGLTILGLVTGADQQRARVAELLGQVGLHADLSERYPHELSGGQCQRVSIARALAAEPSALVLDEPLSSLDASAQTELADLLLGLARELDIGMLLISHDLAIVRRVADVVAVMYLGVIVERGPTADLWSCPRHPYTEALIAAVPLVDGTGTLPAALPGEVPDPAQPPSGCRFHPRCGYAMHRCGVDEPTLVEVGGSRSVACWLTQLNGETLTTKEGRACLKQC